MEEDIEDLLESQDNPFEYAFSTGDYGEYMIIPAVINGYSTFDVIYCGKISRAWKKTKRFVKKHKKAIIIGAVVVVVATAVVVAVVATGGVGAAPLAAASTAGAIGSSSNDSKSENSSSLPNPNQSPSLVTPNAL